MKNKDYVGFLSVYFYIQNIMYKLYDILYMIFDCFVHLYFFVHLCVILCDEKTKIENLALLHLGLYTKNLLLHQFFPHSKQEAKA